MKGKIPRSLAHDIQENIDHLKGQAEIECKIKFFDHKSYDNTISRLDNWKKKTLHVINIYRGEKRFTKVGDKYFNTTKSSPSLLEIVTYDDYYLKFSVSKENYKEVKEPKKIDFTKIKEIISFSKGNIRVILNNKEDEEEEEETEIKIKVIDPSRFNYLEFIDTVYKILDAQVDPRKLLNSFFNKSLGGMAKSDENLNWNLITRPRNLTMKDLTNDGLLDNYSITVKADGLMRFLIFHSTGIWFVQFSGIYDNDYEFICPLPDKVGESIFQGELVGTSFYPFDCCVYNGKVVTDLNYLQRIKYINNILETRYGKYNILELKQFPYSQKKIEFFNQTREALKELEKVPYKTDGLIFHPIYSPYFPSGSDKEKEQRVLSKYKDVCKWKPSELQTLDFLVNDGELYVKNNILFRGTDQNPFSKSNYTLDMSDIEGKIVEFKPEKKGDLFIYKPIRIRSDKKYPNSLIVAIEGWEMIKDPITTDMLTGRSTKLLRRYLHELRKEKIQNFPTDSSYLDIYPPCSKELETDYHKRKDVVILLNDKKCGDLKFITSLDQLDYYSELVVNYLLPTADMKKFDKIKIKTKKIIFNYLFISSSKLRSLFSIKGNEISFNDIIIRRLDSDTYNLISPEGEYQYKLKEYDVDSITPSGKKITDYILSKNERDLLQMFIMGTKQIDIKLTEKSGRIPVDISKGTRRKSGFNALGDDKLEHFYDDFYRMATIDEGKSFEHSLLKLLNGKYRSESLEKRLEMVEDVNFSTDLNKLSKNIKLSIVVKQQGKEDQKYGKEDKYIILYKNDDGSYEPVVRKREKREKNGEDVDMVFS